MVWRVCWREALIDICPQLPHAAPPTPLSRISFSPTDKFLVVSPGYETVYNTDHRKRENRIGIIIALERLPLPQSWLPPAPGPRPSPRPPPPAPRRNSPR